MTDVRRTILSAIFEAVDQVNEQLPAERRVPADPAAKLSGSGGHLDSLGLVNLVLAAEQTLSDALGVTVILTDDPALFEPEGPLASVHRLADHVTTLLERTTDG